MKLSFYQVALFGVWLQHQGSNPTGFCTAPLKHHNCHKKTCTKKLMKYRDKSTCYLKKKMMFWVSPPGLKRQVNCVYVLFYSCWNVPTCYMQGGTISQFRDYMQYWTLDILMNIRRREEVPSLHKEEKGWQKQILCRGFFMGKGCNIVSNEKR